MNIDINQLIAIIKNVAKEELLPRFENVTINYKTDGSIITEADTAAQISIQTQLNNLYPEISFLGEEMNEAEQLNALKNN